MARVTRSRNIDISEDQTLSPVASNFSFRGDHLTELSNTNAMAHAQQNPLAAELKGLKAAYRTAIGGVRKGPKRTKRQNKSKSDSSCTEGSEAQKETEGLDAQLNVTPVPEVGRSTLQSRQDEQQRFELPIEQTQAPERRTTRRQAAKAQAAEKVSSKSSLANSEDSGNTVALRDLTGTSSSHAVTTNTKENVVGKDGVATEVLTRREYTLTSRSPIRSPVKTLEDVERSLVLDRAATASDDEEDSFVQQIITRSPAKPVSRIEDSVEALDQLEDALEALDEAALAEVMVSPEKTRQKSHREAPGAVDSVKVREKRRTERKPLQEDIFQPLATKSQSTKPGYSSVRIKSTITKAPVLKKATSMIFRSQTPSEASNADKSPLQPTSRALATKRPISMIVKRTESPEKSHPDPAVKTPSKRPLSLLPPRETLKSSKPVTKASFELPSEAISRKLKEQREARQARREANIEPAPPSRAVSGPQVKSTKPLTVSHFELPGEALSRKRKEAAEARLKAEEEEEALKRRELKAKALHKNAVPNVMPQETAASRARQSRIGLESMIENASPKRNSIISNVGAHRPSLAQAIIANTAAPRAPGPVPTLTRKSSTISASGLHMSGRAMQRTVSATDVQVQRQRAKEAYNRDAKLTEDIERERREREAAAKRAREEAAERGRQASREWAERQLAKKMAESDKGMSCGYGPGGQMGLGA